MFSDEARPNSIIKLLSLVNYYTSVLVDHIQQTNNRMNKNTNQMTLRHYIHYVTQKHFNKGNKDKEDD